MRRTLILSSILFAALAIAAQSTWESHTRTGEYAFAVGETERAEEEFQAALAIAQKLPPPDQRLETSLGNLARFYENQDLFAEALPMYQLQVAAAEYRLGGDQPELLAPLIGLARVAMQLGDIPAAEDALQRYRAVAQASGDADPSQYWVALAMLARTCSLQERDEDALGGCYFQDHKLWVRSVGDSAPEAAVLLHEVTHALLSYAYRTHSGLFFLVDGAGGSVDEALAEHLETPMRSLIRDNDLGWVR